MKAVVDSTADGLRTVAGTIGADRDAVALKADIWVPPDSGWSVRW
jgi:hypothetical protein